MGITRPHCSWSSLLATKANTHKPISNTHKPISDFTRKLCIKTIFCVCSRASHHPMLRRPKSKSSKNCRSVQKSQRAQADLFNLSAGSARNEKRQTQVLIVGKDHTASDAMRASSHISRRDDVPASSEQCTRMHYLIMSLESEETKIRK